MKTQTKSTLVQLPRDRKSSCSMFSSLTALAAGLALFGGQSSALAQADNFNDGNDTSPTIAWTQFDAISTIFGVAAQDTWSFPGGNTYRLQAEPSPNPSGAGPARVSSFPPDVYTDFYVSVDVTNNITTYSQVFGLLARAGDFGTLGTPTTRAYGFTYINGSASASGLGQDNYLAIFRLRNDAQTAGVPGTGSDGSLTHCELHGVNLDQTKQYRFVFIGRGTHLEGRVYELPNVSTPVAVLDANTAADGTQWTNGQCGVFAFNLADASGLPYSGPVDVTFDNYYASARCPMNISDMVVKDNFNDGNDTAPTVAWVHSDPISSAVGFPQNAWTFPGGNSYRLQAPEQPFDPQLGQGRVGSLAPGVQTDFRVAADIVNWGGMDQDFGVSARIANLGLGTTTGYLMNYDFGTGFGDMDITRVTGELPTSVPVLGEDSFEMVTGKSYRFVFSGKGSELRALVFELPDTMNPIVDCVATDATYSSGESGLYASAANAAGTADVTFDNYSDTALAAPTVSVVVGSTAGGNVTVSWPGNLECIWVLESSPVVGAGAVWTNVPLVNITYSGSQNIYTGPTPMAETGNTYYRLKQL